MAAVVKLSDLPIGASAVVREFPKAASGSVRLREMGLLATRLRSKSAATT